MTMTEFLFDAAVALALGAAVGAERQFRQHPAGLRTNALVCLGAALFVSVSRLIGDTTSPTRVASYVVSGVGFLGGGVILRDGMTVKGIDTAATLWCAAALGVLAGSGFPAEATAGAAMLLGLNLGLRPLARRIDALSVLVGGTSGYRIRVVCQGKARAHAQAELRKRLDELPGVVVQGIVARQTKRRKRATVSVEFSSEKRDDRAVEVIVTHLGQLPGVLAAEWEALAVERG